MAKVDNTVGRVLNGRTLITLAPDQTVHEAAIVLGSHAIGAAPVLEADRLVGLLSERDLLQRVIAAGRDPDATRVRDVMTIGPRTIDLKTSLVNAYAIMIEGKFRHLPVVDDDGKVVAMLSMRDVPLENQIMHRRWTEWTHDKLEGLYRRSTIAA